MSAMRARDELYITGQWRAYVKVDEANPKNRQEKMNRYLIDSFKAAGNAVTDEGISAAFAEYKAKRSVSRMGRNQGRQVYALSC